MKRVYVDTSVFGGVFDNVFEKASQDFFDQIKNGQFILVTSAIVQEEIAPAPKTVNDFFVTCTMPLIYCMAITKFQFIRLWR
ncbi:MAG: hypothetical protein ACREOI_23290 [bacterium]